MDAPGACGEFKFACPSTGRLTIYVVTEAVKS